MRDALANKGLLTDARQKLSLALRRVPPICDPLEK